MTRKESQNSSKGGFLIKNGMVKYSKKSDVSFCEAVRKLTGAKTYKSVDAAFAALKKLMEEKYG